MKVFIVNKGDETLAVFDCADKAFEFADFYEIRNDYRGLTLTARTLNKVPEDRLDEKTNE